MIIEKVYIGQFGRLHDRSFVFGGGINLIEGDNESGKTTLVSFIRYVFYGISNDREAYGGDYERFVGESDRKPYGFLELSCEKGRFRIERSSSGDRTGEDTVTVIDLQKCAPIKGKDPAALFLGVPEAIFERSCFLSQTRHRGIGPEHLAAAVENMISSADESISAGRSAAALGAELGELAGSNGTIDGVKEQRADLQRRIAAAEEAEEEYRKTAESLKDNLKKIENNRAELAECKKQLAHADALRKLERVKRAGNASGKLEEAKAARAAYIAEKSFDGFLPDRAYAKALHSAAATAKELESTLEERKNAIARDNERLKKLPEPVKGREGRLLADIQTYSVQAALCKNRMIVGYAAALLLAGAAVFLVLRPEGKGIIGAIICAVLTLAALGFCLLNRSRQRTMLAEREKLYDSVGARNKEELTEAVERHAKLVAERSALRESIDETTAKQSSEKEALARVISDAEAETSRWGRDCANAAQISETAALADEVCDRLDELAGAEKQAQTEFSALEIEVTEKEIKELLTLVRTDGVEKDLTPEEYKSLSMKVNFYTQTVDGLEKRSALQKDRLVKLEAGMEDSGALRVCEKECAEKLAECLRRQKVLEAARAAILETITYMRDKILPDVLKSAGEFLSDATSGKYVAFEASPEFDLNVLDADGKKHPIVTLSGGTAELCYIALRFGMTEQLYGGRRMPMFFDESFGYFDDLRRAAVFMALSGRANDGKNQIFTATCRKRDGALLERITPITRIPV